MLDIGLTQAYELARNDELPVPTIRVGRQLRFSTRLVEALRAGTYQRPEA